MNIMVSWIFSLAQSMGWLTAGFLVSTSGINPFLSILLFELPFTLHCWKKGYLETYTPFIVYLICLLLFSLLSGFGLWLGFTFSLSNLPFFAFTIGICTIINLIHIQDRESRMTEFLIDNSVYMSRVDDQAFFLKYKPQYRQSDAKTLTPLSQAKAYPMLLRMLKRYFCIQIKIGTLKIRIE